MHVKLTAAQQPNQSDRYEIEGDDVIEQARNDQDQYTGDQRYHRTDTQAGMHVQNTPVASAYTRSPGAGVAMPAGRNHHGVPTDTHLDGQLLALIA